MTFLNTINVCINTSISALDNPDLLKNSLEQYNRLKPFCKSILRIVSCDFNIENPEGLRLSIIQHNLFKNESVIDTVFRPNKNNEYIKQGIINVKLAYFMGKKHLVSQFNRKTFLGKCDKCSEMCGAKMQTKDYENKRALTKQLSLLK